MDEFYDLVNQVRPVSLLSIDDSHTFSNVDKKSILNLLETCKINNPFNQLNLKTIKDIVTQAIEELPEKQRLVLSLIIIEDLNLKEIGKVLDVTESRVSQLHAQAVTRLRANWSPTSATKKSPPNYLPPESIREYRSRGRSRWIGRRFR